MNLKEARTKGQVEQFIKEHELKFPHADKKNFQKLIKAAASGTLKPKSGTSKKRGRAG